MGEIRVQVKLVPQVPAVGCAGLAGVCVARNA